MEFANVTSVGLKRFAIAARCRVLPFVLFMESAIVASAIVNILGRVLIVRVIRQQCVLIPIVQAMAIANAVFVNARVVGSMTIVRAVWLLVKIFVLVMESAIVAFVNVILVFLVLIVLASSMRHVLRRKLVSIVLVMEVADVVFAHAILDGEKMIAVAISRLVLLSVLAMETAFVVHATVLNLGVEKTVPAI